MTSISFSGLSQDGNQDFTNVIQSLTSTFTIPTRLQGRVACTPNIVDRVKQIQQVLSQQPDLVQNDELMERIFTFIKESHHEDVRNFRNALAFQVCCSKVDDIYKIDLKEYVPEHEQARVIHQVPTSYGHLNVKTSTLTLTIKSLEEIKEKLWDILQQEEVKTLVIRLPNQQSIEYGINLLNILAQQKPTISFLHEEVELIFPGEFSLALPKAKLMCCGDYFSPLLTGGYAETFSNVIDLSQSPVTLNGFSGILRLLEDGVISSEVTEEYHEAVEYLQFSQSQKIPENFYGSTLWERYFGKVDGFDPPRAMLEEVEALKKAGENPLVFFVPTKVDDKTFCHDLLKELIKNPKEGNKTKFNFESSSLTSAQKSTPPNRPYWVIMTKDVLSETKGITFNEQKQKVKEYSENKDKVYEPPNFLEAELGILLHFVHTGERLLALDPLTYTRCTDTVLVNDNKYQLVVGGFSPDGPCVCSYYGITCYVGLAPVRRFYRS